MTPSRPTVSSASASTPRATDIMSRSCARTCSRPPTRSPSPSRPPGMPTPAGPRATPKEIWICSLSAFALMPLVTTRTTWNSSSACCPGRKQSRSASPSRIGITARCIFPNARPIPWNLSHALALRSSSIRLRRPRRRPAFAQLRELAGAWRARPSTRRVWLTSSTIAWHVSFPSWLWTGSRLRTVLGTAVAREVPLPAQDRRCAICPRS